MKLKARTLSSPETGQNFLILPSGAIKVKAWLQAHPLWLLIGVALAIRILPATVRFVIGSDDGLFLTLGQNLAAGRGYTGDGLTTQIDFPPGYPFFAAAVYWLGGGLEWPTRLNILLFGTLLPVPVFWLTHQLTNQKIALMAGLLTALHPALVLSQGNFESVAEIPYALLLYTTWAVLWWGLTQRRLWAFGVTGLTLGAAHLVRWEGLILGLLVVGLIIFFLRWASWKPALFFSICLALFAVPYGLYLYQHTGSFLSPKTMLTQLHAAAIDASATDPYAFEKYFYEPYEIWLANPRIPPQVLQDRQTAFLDRYLDNLLFQARLWLTSLSMVTVVWLIPFLLGLLTLERKRVLFLLPLFVPLAVIPASVVDPRYFLPPLPAAMILVAYGWSWLEERGPFFRLPGLKQPGIGGSSGELRPLLGMSLATALFAVTLLLFTLASLVGPFLYPRPTEYRTAGLALRSELPAGTHILARKRQLPFYAGGVWEWLPYADLEGVLAYAERRRADYLVLDQYTTPGLRPQLAYLLDPTQAPSSLMPVYVDPKGTVVVYRINH